MIFSMIALGGGAVEVHAHEMRICNVELRILNVNMSDSPAKQCRTHRRTLGEHPSTLLFGGPLKSHAASLAELGESSPVQIQEHLMGEPAVG